jgi:hypothetical protein
MAAREKRGIFALSSKVRNVFFVIIALVLSVPTAILIGRVVNPACANSISCVKNLSGDYQNGVSGTFMGRAVAPPSYIAQAPPTINVLGDSTVDKHIYVDKCSLHNVLLQ